MKIVFFGTPLFVLPVIETLRLNFELVGIVTTPDENVGRKQLLTPSPVKAALQTANIPILTPEQLNNETATQLQQLSPDLFVVAAYGKIIPQEILDIPRLGSINIHPSLLPLYRGPSPIQSAILQGETQTGISFILMDKDIDHGPLLFQEKVALSGKETFESLAQQLFKLSAELLPKTIEQYSNRTITPVEQDHGQATFCNHIMKEDGYFDSNNPPSPDKLDCMIRAYFPWPTAWTRLQTESGQAEARSRDVRGKEKIVKLLPEKRIQMEGKKPAAFKEFLNGYPELRETIEKFYS